MAYVSKEMKAKLAPLIKLICRKYGVKASLAVRNNSSLELNIKSAPIDFIGNHTEVYNKKNFNNTQYQTQNNLDVNVYWYHEQFSGVAKDFLDEIIPALKGEDFFDDSDIQSDYFNCSHYYHVNVGQWDKPFVLMA